MKKCIYILALTITSITTIQGQYLELIGAGLDLVGVNLSSGEAADQQVQLKQLKHLEKLTKHNKQVQAMYKTSSFIESLAMVKTAYETAERMHQNITALEIRNDLIEGQTSTSTFMSVMNTTPYILLEQQMETHITTCYDLLTVALGSQKMTLSDRLEHAVDAMTYLNNALAVIVKLDGMVYRAYKEAKKLADWKTTKDAILNY